MKNYNFISKLFIYPLLLLGLTLNIFAKDTNELVIGTKLAPPFAYKNSNGEWEGVSIDLWKEIAKKLNLKYRFQEEDDIYALMKKIKDSQYSIGIAAITATAKRERFADFSNGYFTEELSIAIPKNEGSIYHILLDKLFSYTTLWVILGIIVVIHVAGIAFWLMEKSDGNNKSALEGINRGIWWAATTMTTVGYGDVTPKTFGGRVVAIIWMFISMFLVAIFIASFASFFTNNQKKYFITKPEDLSKGVIATIHSSFSDDYLKQRGIVPVYYDTLEDALNAVKNKEVDAALYDRDLLKFIINKQFKDSIKLTQAHFMPQNYTFIFKNNYHLKEQINRALLDVIESDRWKEIKAKYLK